ncbi:MAG: MmcQ/YjbR family DNA-binding protein [Actinobacteria bacterium]|nr:MAG: MmcQ/YjbR family DNA-binding protein [Actinomycetota bacterium]
MARFGLNVQAVPVSVDEVCALARTLPRAGEAFVRGRVKFRVGSIVFLSFSKDGETMGFGFPKEWRATLVENEPEKFSLPSESDMRFHWVHVRLDSIDQDEMRDLVENAWALCAPKFLVEEYATAQGYRRGD